MTTHDALQGLVGHLVVIDLTSPYVVLGRLEKWDASYIHLAEADVHDLRESQSTRDYYVVEAQANGIQANRKAVLVREAEIVSVAALDDVLS